MTNSSMMKSSCRQQSLAAEQKPDDKQQEVEENVMECTLFGFSSFLLGLLLGHRFALWRDRRKEFNRIAQPIREILIQERKQPSPYVPGVSEIDADRLESYTVFWRRAGLRRDWQAYFQIKQQTTCDAMGGMSFAEEEKVIAHVCRLLPYTEPR